MITPVLPAGMLVRWLGHSTFSVQGPAPQQRFLFDPFLKHNPRFPKELEETFFRPGAFDALLVTHPHFDHFDDVVPLLKGDPALKVVTQFEIGAWLKSQGVKEDQVVGMNTGATITLGDVRITMVPAVHTSSVDDKGVSRALGSPIGYVLRYADGFCLYNTGDTAATMEMQIVRDLYQPDLVILPIGDFFTMGAEQAAYALNLLQPRFAIGCHWGTWEGKPPGTPEALEKELARYTIPTQLIKLNPGDTLT
jgi:L-ascorbate metabolism protein UlaG (beta-lactamase superfamily)